MILQEKKNNLQYEGKRIESSDERLTDWAKEPSILALKDDLKISQPSHDAQIKRISDWLDLRNIEGSAKPKTNGENRSKVQPRLVRRQNEWRYSALSEPFLGADKAVQVSPRTWEDVKGAQQNELLLNWQLESKLNWTAFIDEYVRTAVDEGTVVVRVGWERESIPEEVDVPVWTYFAVQTQEEMQMLEQAMQLQQANPNAFLDLPESLRESVAYSMEQGIPAIAQQTGVERVNQQKVTRNQPSLEVLDFDNVYIDPSCNGNLDKANFVILSFETSKAALLKDGRYKNLDKVNWASAAPYIDADHMSRIDATAQFRDDLRRPVVAYEYWGFYDINGDDILVPIVATWIGDTMIRLELNPYPDQKIPLVVVPYMPVKKSITGEPDAELLGDNQSILGAVTRGMIDLLGRSANGQTGYAKGMLDAVNRKRLQSGADYEFNPNLPPSAGMIQHKYPEIPQSALTMLQLQNQEAESLTGVKAFSGGMSGNAYGDVAAGIRGMLDAASKREMNILRRLAKGVVQICQKISAMNSVFLTEEEVVRVTNDKFEKVRREDLIGNFDFKVDITTAEIQEAKAQDLAFMLQTMGNNMDFNMTKMILSEIAKLKRMPELAHAIINFQPQPDPMQEQMKQLELQKLQMEIAELQSKIMLNQAKARMEASGADQKDLDYVEQATGTKHLREIDKQHAQASANSDLEITKRILDPEGMNKENDVTAAIRYKNLAEVLTKAQNT